MSQQVDVALSTYEVIEVAAAAGPHAQMRLRVAVDLAERLKSMLIGVAARDLTLTNYGAAVPTSGDFLRVEVDEVKRALRAAKDAFDRAAASLPKKEWRSELARPEIFMAEQARAADLLIVGNEGARDDDDEDMTADAGQIIMSAGRPVLVVPPHVERIAAQSILIAWKDSTEARRAVTGAMPMLQRAEKVCLFTVGEESAQSALLDVQAFLGRHGVAAGIAVEKTPARPAAEIVRAAQSRGADLIVAGAYGYSRMREWIFGGVTHSLLKHSPIACLLTH